MEEQDHVHSRPDPDDVNYPAVLELTSMPAEEYRRRTIEHAERFEDGEEPSHMRNFENPSDLRALLTTRRLELLRHIMDEPPESIRSLADELDRDVRQVHDDLQLLAEDGIVHFKQGQGNAKRPFIPYERVEVSMTILDRDTSGEQRPVQAD